MGKSAVRDLDTEKQACYHNLDFLVGIVEMKVTARERVGLRAMVEFARRYGVGPVSLTKVARAQDMPRPYLARVVASLRRSGLLSSVRGAHGGYMLTRDPSAITVGDVFRALEGSLMALDCMRTDGSSCDREPICAARPVWLTVIERVNETLDNTSLADIVD